MPRWETDGRERLEEAALELFLDVGYDGTTIAGIAKRAGLTERSFYRHFADKREVLFARDQILIDHLVSQLETALQEHQPFEAMVEAIASADEVFLPADRVRRRAAAIERSTALTERERGKLAALADALTVVLRERGLSQRSSRMLASLGLSLLEVASADRLVESTPFAELVHRAASEQRRLLAPVDRAR